MRTRLVREAIETIRRQGGTGHFLPIGCCRAVGGRLPTASGRGHIGILSAGR